jgi:N-acetylglucosaminyldiphosphoundecaprenol N-acetyl-beta-D-mannosaminyltransferase
VDTSTITRTAILDVPVDSVTADDALACARELLDGEEHQQIVTLSMESFARARHDQEYSRALRQAPLVLPVSRTLAKAGAALGRPPLHASVPFDLIIRLLGVADEAGAAVYLLGGHKEHLERTEKNLRVSFPHLRLVGRYAGYYASRVEQDIITAIRKSGPRLILVGGGVPGGELWSLRHRRQLPPGLSLWVGDCFEIFAGAKTQTPRSLYEAGTESFSGWVLRPWRLFRVFRRLGFWASILVSRIRKG